MAANLELIISATDKASGALSSIDKKASGLGSTLTKVGGVASAGVVAGLGIASVAAVKFIGAASDLNEVTNKAAVVFGGASEAVNAFAASSAKSFGIAKSDALGYASTLGTILKGSGLAEGATADMSVGLTKLAADMASFNNIPIDQALEKIRAGLVGESEPLRTVGVLLSEAAVQEEAYASGIAERGAKLTDQQKVQARYNLILKQTADTQGDFARTSDSLANRQRILGAQWENIQAILGNALLPLVTALAIAFSNFLSEHEQDIQEIVTAMSAWAENDAFPMIGRALEQLIQLFNGIMDTGIIQWLADHKLALIALGIALGGLALAFGGPVIWIGVLITAGTLLLAHWDEIRAKIDQILEDFNTKFPRMAAIIETVFALIKNRVMFYVDLVRDIIRIGVAIWHGDFSAAWEGIKALFTNALGHIRFEFQHAVQLIAQLFAPLTGIMREPFDVARNAVEWLIRKIKELIALVPSIPNLPDMTPGFNAPGVPGVPGLRSILGSAPLSAALPATSKGGTVIFQSVVPAGPAEMQRAAITIREILRS